MIKKTLCNCGKNPGFHELGVCATENKWIEVGIVGVDAGLIWLGDPCYIMGDDASERVKDWGEFCSIIDDEDAQQFNYKLGHAGLGVLVNNFGGDGVFPVFIKKNKDGLVAEVKIIFNEE